MTKRTQHHGHHHPTRVRTIRPRPLNHEERLAVVFLNRKREKDEEPIDPALVQFLKAEEAEHEAQRSAEEARAKVGGW